MAGTDRVAERGAEFTAFQSHCGHGVVSKTVKASSMPTSLRAEIQRATADAEEIVRRATHVANFVFDSTGRAPKPHFQFFFETGVIKITRKREGVNDVLRVLFHELAFDPEKTKEAHNGFIKACRRVIELSKKVGLATDSALAYDGTNRCKLASVAKLRCSGFEKKTTGAGLLQLKNLALSGIGECSTALQASLFISSLRTTMIMIKEFRSAFNNLRVRYEGDIFLKEQGIKDAKASNNRATANLLSRELVESKRVLEVIVEKKLSIDELDIFALYHTAFMQAKLKAKVLEEGEILSKRALGKYQAELRKRILDNTSVSQRDRLFGVWSEDVPGSREAREAYADSVSGMIVSSKAFKSDLGCPYETTYEEALVVQANAIVLASNYSGLHGVPQAGLPKGAFKGLGEDIETFFMKATAHAQKVATLWAGHMNTVEREGRSYTICDSKGKVRVKDHDGRALGIDEGYRLIVNSLESVLSEEIFETVCDRVGVNSQTRSMSRFVRGHLGGKTPSAAYAEKGIESEVAAPAEGVIPPFRVPKSRGVGAGDDLSYYRGLASVGLEREEEVAGAGSPARSTVSEASSVSVGGSLTEA